MNKQTYRKARALVRANGSYALRWMTADVRRVMHTLAAPMDDYLSERAWLAVYKEAHEGRLSNLRAHMVRAVPCPSQRSAMHVATMVRTMARHAAQLEQASAEAGTAIAT